LNYFEKIALDYHQLVQVTSFIRWPKNESDTLSELVYLLKTRTSTAAWAWFVQAIESEICNLISSDPGCILIPVPGSKESSYHTLNFGNAIQNLTGCQSVPLLRKAAGQKNQKTQTALERTAAKFEINEEFTGRLENIHQIYLIDDIVTTGATLKNISKILRQSLSLDQQEKIKITGLTLFYRTKAP